MVIQDLQLLTMDETEILEDEKRPWQSFGKES